MPLKIRTLITHAFNNDANGLAKACVPLGCVSLKKKRGSLAVLLLIIRLLVGSQMKSCFTDFLFLIKICLRLYSSFWFVS